MAISLQTILFYFFAAVAVLSALMMILHRSPVYCVIFMIVTLFALAGLYVLLNAPFIAAVHIIVYAGAIMVLFLFVVMLLPHKRDSIHERGKLGPRVIATLLVVLFLVEIGVLIGASYFTISHGAAAIDSGHPWSGPNVGLTNPPASDQVGNTTNIGRQLFTTYLLPFEIASVLLLVAIIGAVILAKRKLKEDDQKYA